MNHAAVIAGGVGDTVDARISALKGVGASIAMFSAELAAPRPAPWEITGHRAAVMKTQGNGDCLLQLAVARLRKDEVTAAV